MTDTVKCFKKSTIIQANKIAAKRNYNRQLDKKFVDSLDDDMWFPIVMTLMHEHAQGKKVDPHIRCWVVFDEIGNRAFIDCDMDLYEALQVFDLPEKAEAQ